MIREFFREPHVVGMAYIGNCETVQLTCECQGCGERSVLEIPRGNWRHWKFKRDAQQELANLRAREKSGVPFTETEKANHKRRKAIAQEWHRMPVRQVFNRLEPHHRHLIERGYCAGCAKRKRSRSGR